jgi:hypothetical protein
MIERKRGDERRGLEAFAFSTVASVGTDCIAMPLSRAPWPAGSGRSAASRATAA